MTRGIANNLIGEKFNRLTVMNLSYIDTHKKIYWECLCDCGNIVVVRGAGLKCGDNQSCGCYHKELTSKMFKKPDGTAAFNKLFSEYKRNAFKKSHTFNLTEEEFREIVNKNCFYCGCTPNTTYKSRKDRYIYNGIDRVNNAKGYILGNIVSCCSACNHAKNTMSKEDFLSWIKRVYKNLEKRGDLI